MAMQAQPHMHLGKEARKAKDGFGLHPEFQSPLAEAGSSAL